MDGGLQTMLGPDAEWDRGESEVVQEGPEVREARSEELGPRVRRSHSAARWTRERKRCGDDAGGKEDSQGHTAHPQSKGKVLR